MIPATEWLPIIAAVASAIAALAAVFATWNAPRSAASYAESLRKRNEREEEIQRQKLYIFSELMKARGVQITREAVAAFNLIDLVFLDSQIVRDSWAELYSAYTKRGPPSPVIDDKLKNLLKVMAQDVGLSESLRPADFERYYYPMALAEEDRARTAQNQALLANVGDATERASFFPPRPNSD